MSNFKRVLTYVNKYKVQVILAILCAFITNIGVVVATYLSGLAIDEIGGVGNVNFESLFIILIALGFIYLIASIFQWFISRYANKVSYLIVRDMRRDTFESLNKQPLAYYDHNPHGDIISRFTNDLDNVSDALAVSITNVFSGAVTVITALICMLYLNVKITLAILVVTPICFLIASMISKFSQRSFLKQQQSVGELSSFVSEIVGNQKIVKAFHREKIAMEQFRKISDNLCATATNAMFASALINPSTRFINNISYIAVGLVGGILAIKEGVSVGIVSSFLIYSAQFAKPFNEISGITSQIQTAFASLKGKPLEVMNIPLNVGMSIGVLLVSVELILMLTILLFVPGNLAGACFIGFAIGESLGASALRVAGGIFTKIADIGSDLMKIEFNIKEDDPRNPGVIADCTGDNAGDSIGPTADGFETYGVTGVALVSFILLAVKPQYQIPLLTWIFTMRFLMIITSVVSYKIPF